MIQDAIKELAGLLDYSPLLNNLTIITQNHIVVKYNDKETNEEKEKHFKAEGKEYVSVLFTEWMEEYFSLE